MHSLEIRNLKIETSERTLVHNVHLSLQAGQVCAMVGSSGSGKSLSCLGLLDLLPPGLVRTGGECTLDGIPIASDRLRGEIASLILQNPRSAFNPVRTVGDHARETLARRGIYGRPAKACIEECLESVGLTDQRDLLAAFAFQLSGGTLQRAMIALALMARTPFLLADEPTSNLDVLNQAKFLDLLMDLVNVHNLGVLLVTHDMGVVARCADRVCVMQDGYIVENTDVHSLFSCPKSKLANTLIEAHKTLNECCL